MLPLKLCLVSCMLLTYKILYDGNKYCQFYVMAAPAPSLCFYSFNTGFYDSNLDLFNLKWM